MSSSNNSQLFPMLPMELELLIMEYEHNLKYERVMNQIIPETWKVIREFTNEECFRKNNIYYDDIYDEASIYESGDNVYAVFDEYSRNEAIWTQLQEDIYELDAVFLLEIMESNPALNTSVIECIKEAREDGRELLISFLRDKDEVIDVVDRYNEAGTFLAQYDGREHQHEYNDATYYIYRI